MTDQTFIHCSGYVAASDNVALLWGGRTADEGTDSWNVTSGGGLPELPSQYGTAPELSNEPF